jgi:type VI secretion system protein
MKIKQIHIPFKIIAWLLVVAGLVNLSGCGVVNSVSNFILPSGSKLGWTGVTLVAASDANLNSPVAIDLVLVRDAMALSALTSMSAAKWFSTRADLLKTFPADLRYLSLEISPGQTLTLTSEQIGSDRLAGAFMFANYLTPGEHRMRVDQIEGNVVVRVGNQSFLATATAPN